MHFANYIRKKTKATMTTTFQKYCFLGDQFRRLNYYLSDHSENATTTTTTTATTTTVTSTTTTTTTTAAATTAATTTTTTTNQNWQKSKAPFFTRVLLSFSGSWNEVWSSQNHVYEVGRAIMPGETVLVLPFRMFHLAETITTTMIRPKGSQKTSILKCHRLQLSH